MKCVLMNKNKEVCLIELETQYNNITNVYEIYNKNYLPLGVFNALNNPAESVTKKLNNWFRGRGIPSWRKDLERLLEKLNILSPEELLNKAYGLSLSDQYWLKDVEQNNLKWDDINFFTNEFEYQGYLDASFADSKNKDISLRSPNNTTDGMIQKAWIIENGKRVLVKGTYYSTNQEPINEWIASLICEKLGINYCNYSVDVIDKKIVSRCDDFINENEEFISAFDIFFSKKKENDISDFEHYIRVLDAHGITDARNFMSVADANKPSKVKSLQIKKIGEDKNGYVEVDTEFGHAYIKASKLHEEVEEDLEENKEEKKYNHKEVAEAYFDGFFKD